MSGRDSSSNIFKLSLECHDDLNERQLKDSIIDHVIHIHPCPQSQPFKFLQFSLSVS